jgi:hypothetical protein
MSRASGPACGADRARRLSHKQTADAVSRRCGLAPKQASFYLKHRFKPINGRAKSAASFGSSQAGRQARRVTCDLIVFPLGKISFGFDYNQVKRRDREGLNWPASGTRRIDEMRVSFSSPWLL